MVTVALLAVAGGLVVLASALIYQTAKRPKYLLTVQKQVDVNRPETVTFQANFPDGTTDEAMWETTERLADIAVCRADTVNAQILKVVAEENARIEARRAALRNELDRKRIERKRRKLSRRLGIPADRVTDEMVACMLGVPASNGDGTETETAETPR
jgi:hypothetical protein